MRDPEVLAHAGVCMSSQVSSVPYCQLPLTAILRLVGYGHEERVQGRKEGRVSPRNGSRARNIRAGGNGLIFFWVISHRVGLSNRSSMSISKL